LAGLPNAARHVARTMCDREQATTTPGYAIDPNRDRLIALARLVEWYEARTGRRLHRSVTYRWRQRGVRAEDGSLLRLPTLRIGGVRYTSEEAIAWWTAAIDGQPAAAAAARAAVVAASAEDDATLRRAGVI
jgi:hypothetical protein